jgi:type II secretory pathway component PulF
MPIYSYTGLDRSGKEIKNTVNTDSIISAKQKIRALGVMLTEIKEQRAPSAGGSTFSMSKFQGRVSVDDLALMTRQFATLIRAKIPVVEALSALTEQVDNETLRVVVSEVRQKVTAGAALADGFGSMKIHRIYSYTSADNLRSQGVMRKLELTRDPASDCAFPYDAGNRWEGLVWLADRQSERGH